MISETAPSLAALLYGDMKKKCAGSGKFNSFWKKKNY